MRGSPSAAGRHDGDREDRRPLLPGLDASPPLDDVEVGGVAHSNRIPTGSRSRDREAVGADGVGRNASSLGKSTLHSDQLSFAHTCERYPGPTERIRFASSLPR